MITVAVNPSLKAQLGRGHPWVYRNQVLSAPEIPAGSWVRVQCGRLSAFGRWDPDNLIAVRIFSTRSVPDTAWVADRVAEAWEARASVRATPTTAYRWVYGESDGLPGIVVDLYGEFAVIRTYSPGVEALATWVADALHAHVTLQGIVWRQVSGKVSTWWGKPPPHDLIVEEHGLLLHADLLAGQKTGLYFDQRENRRTLAPWCQGKRVLDCYCYTGAFTLYALRASAASVLACDAAAAAVETARRNVSLNGLDTTRAAFQARDCFEMLDRLATEDRRFDVVILDPPSFAHDRQSRHAAERAYVHLHRRALHCVAPGGLLAAASCTSQVLSLIHI